jgi:hypothetical protein
VSTKLKNGPSKNLMLVERCKLASATMLPKVKIEK